LSSIELAATVVIGAALVLAPIDPQPIRDLNTPAPASTWEPTFDETLARRVRDALGLRHWKPNADHGETETLIAMWSQRELNHLYERVGGAVTTRQVERSTSDGSSTWTATELTLTVDLPGIGRVEAVTDWDEDTGGRDLPVMQAVPDATLIAV
jgi:hypothetical protein